MRMIFVALALVLVTLAGCARQADDCGSLAVSGAWVRAALPGANVAAGYLAADNGGPTRVVISGAASADFERVEMHRSVEQDGQMRMESVDRLEVAPGDSVAFAPGGRHLMLFGPAPDLDAGNRVQMRLQCGNGEVAFSAEVRESAPGDDAHANH